MKEQFINLLEHITERYNADVQQHYYDMLIDRIPEKETPETMLETIIVMYALRNYPDLLEPPEEEEQ